MALRQPFFVAEITAALAGTTTALVQRPGWAGSPWGMAAWGQPAMIVGIGAQTTVINVSDVGYRTGGGGADGISWENATYGFGLESGGSDAVLLEDPGGTAAVVAYPPYLSAAFAIDRQLLIDPTQPAAGAAWGTLELANADGVYDDLSENWNIAGRQVRILYGEKLIDPGLPARRPGSATYIGSNGTLMTAPPILGPYDRSVPPVRTNYIRYSMTTGAVAGSPGTLPPNWSLIIGGGLTRTVVGVAADGSYIDIRVNGTASATSNNNVIFDQTGLPAIPAAPGQRWTFACNIALVGGTWNPPDVIQTFVMAPYGPAGGALAQVGSATLSPPAAGMLRVSALIVAPTTTATMAPIWRMIINSGAVVDFTIRIGAPQAELSELPTPWIPTSGSVQSAPYPPSVRYDYTAQWMLANKIRNAQMIGASVDTNALPTYYLQGGGGGLTRQIVAIGQDANGNTQLDIRYSGINVSGFLNVTFETLTQIYSTVGTQWTQALTISVINGDTTNCTQFYLILNELDINGVSLVDDVTAVGLPTGTPVRNTATVTTANASCNFVCPRWQMNTSTTLPVDFTLRMTMPQIEHGAVASPYVQTSPAFPPVVLTEGAANNYIGGQLGAIGSTWATVAATPTVVAITAPDGTTSGVVQLVETAATSTHYAFYSFLPLVVLGQTYTFSVFAKASATASLLMLQVGPTLRPVFNLITGTITPSGAAICQMIPLANGWYRCFVTFTSANPSPDSAVYIACRGNFNSYLGTVGTGIYVYGQQFEDGAGSSYIPSGRNLIPYNRSDDSGWTGWAQSNITVTTNNPARDGQLTAMHIMETVSNTNHWAQLGIGTLSDAQQFTFSIYAQAAEQSTVAIFQSGFVGGVIAFDLSAGAVIGTPTIPYAISNAGGGWWRVSATLTKSVAGAATVFVQPNTTSAAYIGTPGSGIMVCDPQVEFGTLTAYAPYATRAADVPPVASRDILIDPAYQMLSLVFSGLGTPWFLNTTALQIPLRDATYWLEQPLQSTLYLGTGGLEGGPALANLPKPIARGGTTSNPIRNITPTLVDEVNRIYQYNDAPGTVVNLYEGGALNITFQADVADLYTGSTTAGQYRTNNARGLFQLGLVPAQGLQITCDVTGQFLVAGVQTSICNIARQLMLDDLQLPPAYLDTASFDAADAKYPYLAGIYFPSDAIIDGASAVSDVLSGTGIKLVSSRVGLLGLIGLDSVLGTQAIALLDGSTIITAIPQPLPTIVDPPPYRFRVGYQHNYTVQTSLSASITATQRAFVAVADRFSAWASGTVLLAYARPNDPPALITTLLLPTDAQLVANRLGTLFGVRQRLYAVTVPVSIGLPLEVGKAISVKYPIAELVNGKLGQIVGEQFQAETGVIVFSVLIDPGG